MTDYPHNHRANSYGADEIPWSDIVDIFSDAPAEPIYEADPIDWDTFHQVLPSAATEGYCSLDIQPSGDLSSFDIDLESGDRMVSIE